MLKLICLFATLILLIETSDGWSWPWKNLTDFDDFYFPGRGGRKGKRDTIGLSGGENLDPGIKE